jgi:hypothetical protein
VLVSWLFGSLPEESTLENLRILEPMKKGEDIDFNTEVYSVLEDPSSSEATTGGAGPGATWGTTFVKQ